MSILSKLEAFKGKHLVNFDRPPIYTGLTQSNARHSVALADVAFSE